MVENPDWFPILGGMSVMYITIMGGNAVTHYHNYGKAQDIINNPIYSETVKDEWRDYAKKEELEFTELSRILGSPFNWNKNEKPSLEEKVGNPDQPSATF